MDKPTMTKGEAGYVNGPVAVRPCKWCFMFDSKWNLLVTSKCFLVKGWISPTGSCDFWKRGFRS